MALNDARWDVQPYYHYSDLVNNYTRAAVAVTVRSADSFSEQVENWMRDNAPWRDRSEAARRKARDRGIPVPEKSARDSLYVYEKMPQSARNKYEALRRNAEKADAARLTRMNEIRAGRGESALSSLPFKSTHATRAERKIATLRGPIVELTFRHGKDVWYGIWLEVANGGRYNIIRRAIYEWSPKADALVNRNANLVQYGFTRDSDEITEAQRFTERMLQWEDENEEEYTPWSEELQAARRNRRSRYPADRASAARRAMEDEELRKKSAESVYRQAGGRGVPSGYRGPTLDLGDRRRGR